MQTVIVGEKIKFMHTYYDSQGDLVDPSDVVVKVVKNLTDILGGPFSYNAGEVTRLGEGVYEFEWETSEHVVPAVYSIRWEATVDGEDRVDFEQFQILDPPVESIGLTDAPRVYGIMRESSQYRQLGIGLTDRIFLIGHGSGLSINAPHQVNSMQETINALGAGFESPLIRALLECYNAGARDLWVMLAAPETEYVPFDRANPNGRNEPRPELGGMSFYERYYERLAVSYETIKDYEVPEIIVPVEASFYNAGNVDFLTQLVDHCSENYSITGSPTLGVLGARIGDMSDQVVDELASDSRLESGYGAGGKFVMVNIGEGVFRLPQMPASYVGSIAASSAATLATGGLDAGLTYRKLPNVLTPSNRGLKGDEVERLCAARLNPLIRTQKGKRGALYQSMLASDNTLSEEGSDYWSILQMRLVAKVLWRIRTLGTRTIGTIGYMQLKSDIREYLAGLVGLDYIRDFEFEMERDPTDQSRAFAEVSLKPYFGVRELFFQVEVGPGV